MHEFIKERFPDYPIYNLESNLVQAEYVDEKQILAGAIQPNLIIAIALGSELVCYPDKDSDVSGVPLKNIMDRDALKNPDEILNHPFLKKIDEQILKIQKEHPDLKVIPPFFWDSSGRATVHGIITTSVKLIGEDALMMTMMNPELLADVHQWITDIYIALIKHYSFIGNIPVTSVHVGECSGSMLTGELFEQFVTPYISQLGKEFGSVRFHSCGKSDHIMDAITKIENLSVIDTGSYTSVRKIRENMGNNIEINISPPVELLLKSSTVEKIIQWLDQVLEENQSGSLKFAYHLEPGYSVENCLAINDELVKRGLVSGGRLY